MTPTHRRELVMNDAMFSIQSGSKAPFSSPVVGSSSSQFLPASLTSLDLSVGPEQLSAAFSLQLKNTSSEPKGKKKQKRSSSTRDPPRSVSPARADTGAKDEARANRLLSK